MTISDVGNIIVSPVDPLNCANDCQNCSEPGVCVEVDSRCQCIVSPVPLNCTNGCRNCSEPGVCVEIDSRCQCTCPVGYTMRTHSFSSCEGSKWFPSLSSLSPFLLPSPLSLPPFQGCRTWQGIGENSFRSQEGKSHNFPSRITP